MGIKTRTKKRGWGGHCNSVNSVGVEHKKAKTVRRAVIERRVEKVSALLAWYRHDDLVG